MRILGIALSLSLLASTAQAVPVQWQVSSGGNGHFYEFVELPTALTWTAARDAALAAGGYLATVTSAAEQAFLDSLAPSSGSRWLGGSDAAVEGEWRWVTGPEAGTQFWQGFSGGSTTAPFNYANWGPGEPNSTAEDYLTWGFNSGGSGWVDVTVNNSIVRRYVIESVPEPSIPFLLGVALAMAATRSPRRNP